MQKLDTQITTIIGVGPILGSVILSEIGDISRFDSPDKLAAYAGIDPTIKQSGQFEGNQNKMSKRGSPYLRRALWLAASSAVLHDSAIRAFYDKKKAQGKHHLTVMGYICRKMVNIIFAVLRNNKPYEPVMPKE